MNPLSQEFLEGVPSDQLLLIVLISIWELIWKGFALWKSAQKKDNLWFVILLLVNTAGLLPALYIFYISKSKKKRKIISLKLPKIPEEGKEQEEEKKKEKSHKGPKKK